MIWFKRILASVLALGLLNSLAVQMYRPELSRTGDPARTTGAVVGRLLVLALIVWLFVSAQRAANRKHGQRRRAVGGAVPGGLTDGASDPGRPDLAAAGGPEAPRTQAHDAGAGPRP